MFTPGLWLELRRWSAAGRRARLWWRDDDAAGASANLDRLLRLSRSAGAPLTLAVIPGGDLRGLAERLSDAPRVTVAQHGLDHVNRRLGPHAGEFPHDWPALEVAVALGRGWRRLRHLPGARLVFVPPWNDIHPGLVEALTMAGYLGWSAYGALGQAAKPPRIDAHLDLLRWRPGARFRGRRRLLNAFAAELRRRRRAGAWEAPIGLLTHHLAHDEPAWAFLSAFLTWTLAHPAVGWVGLDDLFGAPETGD